MKTAEEIIGEEFNRQAAALLDTLGGTRAMSGTLPEWSFESRVGPLRVIPDGTNCYLRFADSARAVRDLHGPASPAVDGDLTMPGVDFTFYSVTPNGKWNMQGIPVGFTAEDRLAMLKNRLRRAGVLA